MKCSLQNLPCTMRLNQLVCTGPGQSYPGGSITTFVGDNKVSVARYRLSLVLMMSHYRPSSGECSEKTRWVKHGNETMDGVLHSLIYNFLLTQTQRPVTTKSPAKTSVTLVRSFGHTR